VTPAHQLPPVRPEPVPAEAVRPEPEPVPAEAVVAHAAPPAPSAPVVAPGAPGHPGLLRVAGPAGPIEYLVTGEGRPSTVFVHGMTGSLTQTRPFGSGVRGTRAFVHLRGHGGTPVPSGADGTPEPGGYRDLADEVAAVIAETGATRALGLSLGAGALARLLADRPEALDRAALVLPSTLDRSLGAEPAARLLAMADAVQAGDVEVLARLLRAHQPASVRRLPSVGVWARRRASELVGTPVDAVLRGFAGLAPLTGPQELAAVTCPVLVVAQDGDVVHPLEVAHRYAEALPHATLVVLPSGGVPWTGRDRLRELITGFLDG
jgi:pimeloyl-ACP methyl ester carboxylesterase